MEASKFRELKDARIWELLFPPETPIQSYANWTPWAPPARPLAIDACVARLHAPLTYNERGAQLKSEAELTAAGIFCPYYHVRHSIWIAVDRGWMWVQLVEAHSQQEDALKAEIKAINDALKTIQCLLGLQPLQGESPQETAVQFMQAIRLPAADEFSRREVALLGRVLQQNGNRLLNFHPPIPLYSDRPDPIEWNQRSTNFRRLEEILWQGLSLLDQHHRQLKSDRQRIKSYRDLSTAWKEGFAASLGYCWNNLTGERPTLTKIKGTGPRRDFSSFVEHAFVSIGGDPGEPWDRAIRTAINDRPEAPPWDGFDRYEKDSFPPGTEFRPSSLLALPVVRRPSK